MLTCRFLPNEALVKLPLGEVGPFYGLRVSHSVDGGRTWTPCSVQPGPYPDALLESSFWEWNEAVRFGNVKLDGPPVPLYWNLYWDGLHGHEGKVVVRVEGLTEEGVESWKADVLLRPSEATFLDVDCWEVPEGWEVVGEGKERRLVPGREGEVLPPVKVRPGLEGRYRVWFGLPYGVFRARLKWFCEPDRYPFAAGERVPEFEHKGPKEVLWKEVVLSSEDELEISLLFRTVQHPELYPFGAVSYIKFVPLKEPIPGPREDARRLALYFEPYSWAFAWGLETREELREAVDLLREMGADEIHIQVIRFGARALHWSNVAERFSGRTPGDDGTLSEGPERMVRSMDVLRETIPLCRERGIFLYANAGLTNCYPGTSLEDRISRGHPEWRRGNLLRYDVPEVREYAAAIVREFAEWGADGVSIDCMRYPYYQAEEDLVLLFGAFFEAVREVRPEGLPIAARIPAGDIVYFRAFERLVKEGIVSCVIPSTLHMRKPSFSLKPYLRWKDYGCRIYGRIDGWKENLWGNVSTALNPKDIREDIERYLREGADGIFVYQADAHLCNPFTRTVLDWRRWG